jgi:hypothetical protein
VASIKVIEDRLKELLNYEEPLGIVIRGEWGVGKSYFWKDFSERYLKNKKVVYISLFGKGSLKELKEDMIVQTFKFYKQAKRIISPLKFIKQLNLPLFSVDVSLESILSLLEPRKLDNLIVCFDEFERLSPKLELREVFGFISYLKENFNCKVVMIINEEMLKRKKQNDKEKLEKENKKENFTQIYNEYKEKIIDYELSFTPSVEENFNIMKNRVLSKLAKDELLSFLKKFNIKNLRTIRQLILILNDFVFIDYLEINNEVKKEFFQKLIRLAYIKIKFNFNKFKELEAYHISRLASNRKESEKDTEFKEILKYLDDLFFVFSLESKDIKIIVDYLKDPVPDKEIVSEVLTEIDKKIQLRRKLNEFEKYFDRLRFDFGYSFEEFKKNIKDFLEENKEDIIHIVGFPSLGSNLSYLISLDPENKNYYINYAEEVLKKFLNEEYMKEIIKDPLYIRDNLIRYIELYPKKIRDVIKTHIEKIEKKVIEKQIKKEILKQKMRDIRAKGGWNPIDEVLLNMTPKNKYKEFMLKDMEFTKEIIYFYESLKSSNSFKKFRSNIKEIFDELEKEERYKIKIKEIKRITGL